MQTTRWPQRNAPFYMSRNPTGKRSLPWSIKQCQPSERIANIFSPIPRNTARSLQASAHIADNLITSSLQMAKMLAEQYGSVFRTPKEALKTPDDIFIGNPHDDTTRHLLDIEFSVADIVKAIKEISATAAAGHDRFPAILLKQCCTTLSKPLYI